MNPSFWKGLDEQARPWVAAELRKRCWTLLQAGAYRWVARRDDERFDFTLTAMSPQELVEQVEDFENLDQYQQRELLEPTRRYSEVRKA